MRIFISIILLLTSIVNSAQTRFSKDLNEVVADSANHFRLFKGSFRKVQEGDSVFESSIVIEGTKKNDIVVAKGMTLYRTVIVDSINEKQGKKSIEEWRQNLISSLGGMFEVEKTKIVTWNPSKEGWKFIRGNLLVSIDLYPYNLNSSLYWVCLGVTYFSFKEMEK